MSKAIKAFKALEKLANGEHALTVCIGDSITEQNYHLHGRLNYVGQLTERLMEVYYRKSRVINAGTSSDTTWGVLERLERDALRFQPDLVIVMLGINDSMQGEERIPEFKSNLESIIRNIKESGSDVLLLTQNMLDFNINEAAVVMRASYPVYIHALREVAAAEEAPLCDIYQKWGEYVGGNSNMHLMLMNDSIHPNERGHALMVQAVYDYLGIPELVVPHNERFKN
ncbi:SGNH/GDSL hydrolase family protein [Paenibacillus eucommiae]|uniref:Lysophospholipase L1-like esterase n=1 Tax=Paenibacillus eucommiae TaxID=1355755 RepID=A0ABS4J5N7_9BACL|nr:SGNH/GDSL hydrolase family protein [Paenibacillus eucommiae]MBP1995150.1 lysophospholipase L1-like esterase [Paenibacillus eucommiae]